MMEGGSVFSTQVQQLYQQQQQGQQQGQQQQAPSVFGMAAAAAFAGGQQGQGDAGNAAAAAGGFDAQQQQLLQQLQQHGGGLMPFQAMMMHDPAMAMQLHTNPEALTAHYAAQAAAQGVPLFTANQGSRRQRARAGQAGGAGAAGMIFDPFSGQFLPAPMGMHQQHHHHGGMQQPQHHQQQQHFQQQGANAGRNSNSAPRGDAADASGAGPSGKAGDANAAPKLSRNRRTSSSFDTAPFPFEMLSEASFADPAAVPNDLHLLSAETLAHALKASTEAGAARQPESASQAIPPVSILDTAGARFADAVGTYRTREAGTWLWVTFKGNLWVVPPPLVIAPPPPPSALEWADKGSVDSPSADAQPQLDVASSPPALPAATPTEESPGAAVAPAEETEEAARSEPEPNAEKKAEATTEESTSTTKAKEAALEEEPTPSTMVPRSPHEHRHVTEFYPPQAPDVRLLLVHYKCAQCMGRNGDFFDDPMSPIPGPSTVTTNGARFAARTKQAARRPADVKLGGMCCDLPWQSVAHVVRLVTGVELEMVDVFAASQSGRCCLWLRDPAETDLLLRRLVGRLWMAPACHGYAVLAPSPEAKQWLLSYLAWLRGAGITRVPFPRHLLTAERWRLAIGNPAEASEGAKGRHRGGRGANRDM